MCATSQNASKSLDFLFLYMYLGKPAALAPFLFAYLLI